MRTTDVHGSESGSPADITVLFIAGDSRCGSTLLSQILGSLDGFVAVGEMWHVWSRGFAKDGICGCGSRFRACPLWNRVIVRAFGQNEPDPDEVRASLHSIVRVRRIPSLLWAGLRTSQYEEALGRLTGLTRALYDAIAAETGARIIVDSSKVPLQGFLLANTPGLQVTTVHLVRDSRAVAYSWQRVRRRPEGSYMPTRSAARSSAGWLSGNLLSEVLRRGSRTYVRIRYEDFAADPQEITRYIASKVASDGLRLPFVDDRRADVALSHSVSGNPVRVDHGPVAVRPDLDWQSQLRPRDRRVVTAMTWPVMYRYGYGKP